MTQVVKYIGLDVHKDLAAGRPVGNAAGYPAL